MSEIRDREGIKLQLKIWADNLIESGCWHEDGELITENCAELDCHYCFINKILSIPEIAKGLEAIEKVQEIFEEIEYRSSQGQLIFTGNNIDWWQALKKGG